MLLWVYYDILMNSNNYCAIYLLFTVYVTTANGAFVGLLHVLLLLIVWSGSII